MSNSERFYIGGQWTAPSVAVPHDVIDPSTGQAVAKINLGGLDDTNAAVAAAKTAFPAWSTTDPEERLSYVLRLRDIYERRIEDMAQAISREMGAPIAMARAQQAPQGTVQIDSAILGFKELKWLRPLRPDTPEDQIVLQPIGVVGLITPWNWPMNQVVLKVVPALLAGCTIVLKPSEEAPLSSILLTELIDDLGLPKGVFNMLHGDGQGVGTQLSEHPDVSMISFTGSTRAGKAISKAAAGTLKRVALELGGKGANLVFDDADSEAVERGVRHIMNNSGQSCNAPSRMFVERSYYEKAVEIAGKVASSIEVGPASKNGAHIGPVVNKTQFDKIQKYIEIGISEGATLIAGGLGHPEGLQDGYYIRPTIFADVKAGSTLEQEEIFGPVMTITPFETEEEAVRMANDTSYGLSNYIQSQDAERVGRVSQALNSGMVHVNGVFPSAGSPFGGVGMSGQAREGGVWGIMEFLVEKAVSGWRAAS